MSQPTRNQHVKQGRSGKIRCSSSSQARARRSHRACHQGTVRFTVHPWSRTLGTLGRAAARTLLQRYETDTSYKILYLGIDANYHDNGKVQLALVFHDATYLVDLVEKKIDLHGDCHPNSPGSVDTVANWVLEALEKYEHENCVKVIGAGVSKTLRDNSPRLCPRLWFELDIVPVIIAKEQLLHTTCFWDVSTVDEQAESLARMCMM